MHEALELAMDLLKVDEGFRKYPYRDTVGKLTIGYGWNLEDRGITEEEAAIFLEDEVIRINNELKSLYNWYEEQPDIVRAIVIDMNYNLGLSGFKKFKKLQQALSDHNYKRAADQMRLSLWCTQTKSRCTRLSKMMEEV